MKKLAIFDLDGTLLNSITGLGKSTNYALSKCGFPERKLEEYPLFVGRGIYNLFRGAMPDNEKDEKDVERMASYFIPHYDKHMYEETVPYEGIGDMLQALQDKGVFIGIATNKYQEGAEKIVHHFFPNIHFVKVLGQRDGQPIKPNPQIIDIMISEAKKIEPKIEKNNVIYIGDSDVDMQTGKNAKVTTVGVTWGYKSKQEIEEFHPELIANSVSELKGELIN